MKLGKDHLVHPDAQALVQLQSASLAGWWVGLEMLFTLFTLEHNAICDALKAAYPEWNDDELFEHARLVNAALLAKIHTVEWTTAILGHPVLQIAMRANWWGLAGRAHQEYVWAAERKRVAERDSGVGDGGLWRAVHADGGVRGGVPDASADSG